MVVIALYIGMRMTGTTFRRLPKVLFFYIKHQGAWGPLIILGLYIARSYLFAPSSILIILSGLLYGPIWGTVINIVGENLSATVCFISARFLGRRFVETHEKSWVKKYDEILTRDGFVSVLFMRLFFFPFDVVSYGSGMTGIPYQQYVLATFLGLLPGGIALTVLGDVFTHPDTIATFIALAILIIVATFFLLRSPRVQRFLGMKNQTHE